MNVLMMVRCDVLCLYSSCFPDEVLDHLDEDRYDWGRMLAPHAKILVSKRFQRMMV